MNLRFNTHDILFGKLLTGCAIGNIIDIFEKKNSNIQIYLPIRIKAVQKNFNLLYFRTIITLFVFVLSKK